MSFLEQALVFISSAVLLVPLFQRLGFGSVLGYLIAGVLVGPHVFQLIPDSESVVHFSEFGVVLLLFIIGLEIQPRKLWSMRNHLLGLGGLQIAFCTVAFMLIGFTLGQPPVLALIVGFALSLSSTAFAVQSLTEKNQFNTEFGRASFSVLLMQDLVAIPAMALIPILASTGSTNTTSPPTFWAFLVLLFLIFTSRFLIRPIFRMIASTRSREVFTAATLFIVLGVATLMQQVGLSAALGTFIAGVLLADSEYRHELETNIEPFKSLLMGLFFIAVGMSVSLETILSRPIFVFSVTLAYLVLKTILIYAVGRLFKMNHENSKKMAVNISQGGEFAFVIFGLLASTGLASSDLITLLTVIVTLSMALSPVCILLGERIYKFKLSKKEAPTYDEIKDEYPKVIIAGFGRFGQIFGRILRAQNIDFVAIDHDSDQIELVRRFGGKVYYGDASRSDILHAAGASHAQFFILAIDDVEISLKTAQSVKENFPHLKIFARARNRGHVFDLMALGINSIKRETFDSSVFFVQDLLVAMGLEPSKAQLIIQKFKQHDEIMLLEQYKVRQDDSTFISVSKQATAQLAQVLNSDSLQSHIVIPTAKENQISQNI